MGRSRHNYAPAPSCRSPNLSIPNIFPTAFFNAIPPPHLQPSSNLLQALTNNIAGSLKTSKSRCCSIRIQAELKGAKHRQRVGSSETRAVSWDCGVSSRIALSTFGSPIEMARSTQKQERGLSSAWHPSARNRKRNIQQTDGIKKEHTTRCRWHLSLLDNRSGPQV